MDFLLDLNFWFTVLRCTTPVLFATLAALVASRSGVLHIGIEGTMTISALFGVIGSAYSGNLFVGLLAGLVSGVAFTMLLSYFILELKADAVITGIALNLAATGGSVFLLFTLTGDKNTSNSLHSVSFPSFQIPLIQNIPFIGKVISGHNVLTYVAFLSAVIIFILLKKTGFGIRVRTVGEAPFAAQSVGLSINRIRYQAMLISGVLASLGGMYLSMGYVDRFTAGMVSGRGYIALATNAMAAGNALMGMFSSVLYGLGSAIAIYLQNKNTDPYITATIPYAAVIVFYILFSYIYKKRNKEKDSL